MLGTLNNNQKSDWKSHVPTLCHAYNAASHDSTGYVPFFLMFGRHPRLAVDAFLGLRPSEPQCRSHDDYVDKLNSRLTFAYDAAAKEAKRNAERHKVIYDRKVRHSTLEPGDRVLVRNVGLRGKQKLADQWEHSPYIVKRQPIQDVPVFEVYKENAHCPKTRLLHRNMLLPFMGLPCQDCCSNTEHKKKEKKPAKEVVIPLVEQSSDNDSTFSDTDEESSETSNSNVPKYVIPARRRPGQKGVSPRVSVRDNFGETESRNRAPRRGLRKRRPPERFHAGQRTIREHSFTVPASSVVYL